MTSSKMSIVTISVIELSAYRYYFPVPILNMKFSLLTWQARNFSVNAFIFCLIHQQNTSKCVTYQQLQHMLKKMKLVTGADENFRLLDDCFCNTTVMHKQLPRPEYPLSTGH